MRNSRPATENNVGTQLAMDAPEERRAMNRVVVGVVGRSISQKAVNWGPERHSDLGKAET